MKLSTIRGGVAEAMSPPGRRLWMKAIAARDSSLPSPGGTPGGRRRPPFSVQAPAPRLQQHVGAVPTQVAAHMNQAQGPFAPPLPPLLPPLLQQFGTFGHGAGGLMGAGPLGMMPSSMPPPPVSTRTGRVLRRGIGSFRSCELCAAGGVFSPARRCGRWIQYSWGLFFYLSLKSKLG